ncbi:PTS sugar transporter subunit IIA [Collinsella sp. AGMB00827]|uniref:PTS sugar transporter subunit IIA n=1 Tax=Collinsella ureilytica TaxID=2869515 RepID=A0ABS7MM40_9ACTN|nr:PTS sugar transporter subunit IIA [Collinsella urealyticum]MBY4798373.1 PTS sugar transporter subunit IIA [Collinsella urealyticum]
MKCILASHGRMSEGLLDTVQMLLGPQTDIEAHVLLPEEEPARLKERLEAAIDPEDEGNIVFFTDLYFGSPFNQVVELSRTHDIYHVTGVNVPALVEAFVARSAGKTAREVSEAAVLGAKDSVKDVRKLMASVPEEEKEGEEF